MLECPALNRFLRAQVGRIKLKRVQNVFAVSAREARMYAGQQKGDSNVLKSITKIKGLGVFANYKAPTGTAEFGVKNLIYGWNYSGKTTLSRLFALLDSKRPNPELPACSFSIETDQGTVTESNYQTCGHTVRVFNSDFVAENLNFAGTPFKPILLLGSESDEAQKEIDRCEAMAKRALAGSEAAKKAADDAKKALDKAKTEAAQRIKATMSLVSFFGATQLEKELLTAGLGLEDYELAATSLEADLKLARSSDQDKLPPVPKVVLALGFDDLHKKAIANLARTPDLASTIDHLVKNPLVESWIESGLPLHDDKSTCEFCGGNLDDHRMANLKAHFSKDLANHKLEVQALLARVESARLAMTPRKEVELNAQFRSRFAAAQTATQKAVDDFNLSAMSLEGDLRKKIQAPFVAITPQALDPSKAEAVTTALEKLNLVIDDNNKVTNNFSSEKASAIDRLKLHYAQEFSKKADVASYEKSQKRYARVQNKYHWCSEQLDTEIQRLKAIISQAQRGREEINKRIETLLGSESVQIAVVKTGDLERFQLVRRDGKPAKHLSEGEKTAIAFSFFLTKLRELKKLGEAVVYIDDPISSLDSNHIFQVTAMIKETFFYQEGENEPWKTRCKQVFFSTHNFEFFSLLRELKPEKSKQGARLYLVKRVAPHESSVENMPESMCRYASEYHFLFDVLNTFHKSGDKTDFKVLMLLPNAVRRFVELYTFSKYPDSRGSTVDRRADRVFGGEKSKRILKVLHYFSHANNIERIAENNDLMCDIEGAVKELMELLEETDPMHMEALKAAVA